MTLMIYVFYYYITDPNQQQQYYGQQPPYPQGPQPGFNPAYGQPQQGYPGKMNFYISHA